MQREASEVPGKLRIFHVLLRLITVVSRLVPFPTRFVAFTLRCVAVFDGVHPVLLRMSRSVTVIMARRVKFIDIKWHIMGISSSILQQ